MITLSPKVKEVKQLRNRIRRQFGTGNITHDLFNRLNEQMDQLDVLLEEAAAQTEQAEEGVLDGNETA